MSPEPRHEGDYTDRQVAAARRVLVDVGQVLASFGDAIVIVGGWVPDLLLPAPAQEHIGSIDVDLALDAAKLGDGRYAELLMLLLEGHGDGEGCDKGEGHAEGERRAEPPILAVGDGVPRFPYAFYGLPGWPITKGRH